MADSKLVSPESSSQQHAWDQNWGYLVALRVSEVKQIKGEDDTVTIRLSGNPSQCKMSKAILIEKSGFFRAMLNSSFQVRSMRPVPAVLGGSKA